MFPLSKLPGGKVARGADVNSLIDRVNILSRITTSGKISSIVSKLGVQIWSTPDAPGQELKIFQVQSATAAEGVYNCYGRLSSGLWGTTNYEVLNLLENYIVSSGYGYAMAYGDTMLGFRGIDENSTPRWMAFPLTPPVRLAKCTEAAGADSNITCNLIANDGETEITSGLGSGITVNAKATLGANLEDAVPRLDNGSYMFVENISGKWWLVQTCQASENCACS
jgi:hypothetical protein